MLDGNNRTLRIMTTNMHSTAKILSFASLPLILAFFIDIYFPSLKMVEASSWILIDNIDNIIGRQLRWHFEQKASSLNQIVSNFGKKVILIYWCNQIFILHVLRLPSCIFFFFKNHLSPYQLTDQRGSPHWCRWREGPFRG